MADTTGFPALIETAVLRVPGMTFHDGFVPKVLPETGGFIDEYTVLWAGLGNSPGERTSDGRHSDDSVVYDFQTNVVAADPDTCRRAARLVGLELTNLQLGTGRVFPNPDGFALSVPILDTQTSPSRFYLPLQWRVITN